MLFFNIGMRKIRRIRPTGKLDYVNRDCPIFLISAAFCHGLDCLALFSLRHSWGSKRLDRTVHIQQFFKRFPAKHAVPPAGYLLLPVQEQLIGFAEGFRPHVPGNIHRGAAGAHHRAPKSVFTQQKRLFFQQCPEFVAVFLKKKFL